MIAEISGALNAITGSATVLQNANGAGRVYELYLMSAIADKLRSEGATVWVRRSDGTTISPGDANRQFIQRGGAPSGLPGGRQGAHGMSVFAFRLKNSLREWEIWNGVQFFGRSGAKHEFDIAVVPAHTASTLRAQKAGGVPFGRPVIAIECKDVSTPGGVDEMRTFVARLYDVTALKTHAPYLTSVCSPLTSIHPGKLPDDEPPRTFRQSNFSSRGILVRRTGFAAGALAMTSYYSIDPRQNVQLGSSQLNSLLADLNTWMCANLA
jgi:hypothetical protein